MGEFGGNDRFDVVRRLGTGGCGVVYEVVDRERQARVALKTLSRLDAAALYRFKREFRALADVAHPNLVQLYELFAAESGWFFTMELVPGRDFLGWVANASPFEALDTISDGALSTIDGRGTVSATHATPALAKIATATGAAVDPARLRVALGELARGIVALHEAGMLHRDLKPNNVLVTEAGRVVIVDYGLAAELGDDGLIRTAADGLAGTPAYMAPEQGDGGEIGPFSDWYSFGVMLYEALTGRLPFLGAPLQILSDKVRFEPPAPRELRKGIPEDLDRLCVDLLRRKPEARPRGAEVLRRLGVIDGPQPALRTLQTHQTASQTFVGRDGALKQLQAAFERAREASCVRVLVNGPSGLGKTALVRRFLDHVAIAHRPVVLSARCYERESVPYKAFDGVVDELSRYLRGLSRSDADALMPRDAAVLARVFPVLARVPAVADAPRRALPQTDPQQMRSRAFGALREMLGRIADRRPLVLFIDDVHWGDIDSAALLAQLTAPPEAPSMLVVLTFRMEDEQSEIVRAFRQSGVGPQRDDVEEIAVDVLSEAESERLAAQLLQVEDGAALAQQIAREAAGSALFIGELVRYVQSKGTRASSAGIRLERVVHERIQDLSEPSARLLEIVATSTRPLHPDLARQAAGLEGDEGAQALTALRLAHFVRTSGANERRVVEVLHERVRDAVLSSLGEAAQRERHGRLADTLRASGDADPELLFAHFRAAGRVEPATEYAELAAAKAERAFAFDRAANFYRQALELRGSEDPSARPLRISLGSALAHAGRGREAAEMFLEATRDANEAERFELQRRAAGQLLQSGHIDQGMEVVQKVLQALGMPLPSTPRTALLALLWLRLWLNVRLLLAGRPVTRDESAVAATMLTKIDVCWSLGVGLAAVDTIRAAQYQARNAMYALSAREPRRLARALALEVVLRSTQGPRNYPAAAAMHQRVLGLVQQSDDSSALAYERLAAAGLGYFTGRWREGAAVFAAHRDAFAAAGVEGRWEQNTMDYFGLCASMALGDFPHCAQRLPMLLRLAEERGDLYLHTMLRVGDTNLLWLVQDDPDSAIRIVDESMGRWSRRSFQTQHYYELQARCNADLYRGEPEKALERIVAGFRDLERAMQMRIFVTRLKAHHTRARAAIRVAQQKGDRTLLALAEQSARALGSEPGEAAPAVAQLIRAGIASARGERDRAVKQLESAANALETAAMGAHAASARFALGRALGGDEGAAMRSAAEQALRELGVRDAARFAGLYVAGFET